MKKSSLSKLALLVPLCALLLPAPCFADAAEDEFEAGRVAYYKKDYKAAEEHFTKSIKLGNRTPKVWLYSGHTFLAARQFERAIRTYETLLKNFKDVPEVKLAQDSLEVAKINLKNAPPPKAPEEAPAATGSKVSAATTTTTATAKPAASGSKGLKDRVTVWKPEPKWGHPSVSAQSVKAIYEAVASLPPHLRKVLDDSGATINIAPNLIDRWPDSINDLDKEEENESPTLAEVPGRIYGKWDMYMYERPKVRSSTNLGNARRPQDIKYTVYNMCFQVLDDIQNISSDPALRAQYNAEKQQVPDSYRDKLATFIKDDEVWGPRETCSDLAADMLGQGDEYSADLTRCFPKTKKWLRAKLGIQ